MTDTASPLDDATSALYAATLQLEAGALNARALAEQLDSAAATARAAYETAAIHTAGPRCGHTETASWGSRTVGPCARPVDHPEAYHRNAAGTSLWRRRPTPNA